MNLIMFYIFLLISFLSNSSEANEGEKDLFKDYLRLNKTQDYYKLHSPTSWTKAKMVCEQEGSILWHPKNNEEALAVFSLVGINYWIHVGLTDSAVEGTFKTVDGISIADVYNMWRTNQPDNAGDEDCVHMNTAYGLNDIVCSAEYSYICKKTKKSSPEADANKDLKDLLKDYLRLNKTQHYYKLHSPTSWTRARMVCEQEGSILWHPKNNEEALAVFSLVGINYWIHVGLTDSAVEGTFKTVDGIPIADVYNKWRTDQPDNAGDEDCVHMNTAYGLNDIVCTEEYSFICKKTKKGLPQWIEQFSTSSLDANKDLKDLIKDYLRLNQTQAYYKYHKATSWTEAKRICEREDSIMWHPKNNEEALAVFSLFEINGWILVGLTDGDVEGTFKTVDGIPVTDVYNKWNKNQPDNDKNAEDCVHMSIHYGLNDISCSDPLYPFICMKSKTSLPQWNEHCNKSSPDVLGYDKFLRKGYEYIETLKAFYKFHITSQTWSDAKRICESDGAQFFYPQNRNEMSNVLLFCKQKAAFSCMFIGISDLFVKGNFATVDGTPLNNVYNDWQFGEPNQLDCSENCIAVNDKGQLNDDSCLRKYPFVCKYTVNVPEWNNNCNMYNLDYTYNEEEGKCYKLHKKALSWTDAYSVCHGEQSYLAVINSKKERDHLLSLTRESSDQVTEVLRRETIHLGFHNRFGEGWLTVRGTTLDNSGYAHWDVDHPKGTNQRNEERCGSMSFAGRLRDVSCDSKRFFICEHDPNM